MTGPHCSHATPHVPAAHGCPKKFSAAEKTPNCLPRLPAIFVLGPTPKSRRKWQESEAETGQNFHRLETFQNSEIDPKYHNQ
ncbi:unnamed protein product [Prunus brigantina]